MSDFIPLQDQLKRIFDDAGGSDTLVDLLREFDFEGSRELADTIVLGMARNEAVLGALEAILEWDQHRGCILPYAVRDPARTAIAKVRGHD